MLSKLILCCKVHDWCYLSKCMYFSPFSWYPLIVKVLFVTIWLPSRVWDNHSEKISSDLLYNHSSKYWQHVSTVIAYLFVMLGMVVRYRIFCGVGCNHSDSRPEVQIIVMSITSFSNVLINSLNCIYKYFSQCSTKNYKIRIILLDITDMKYYQFI